MIKAAGIGGYGIGNAILGAYRRWSRGRQKPSNSSLKLKSAGIEEVDKGRCGSIWSVIMPVREDTTGATLACAKLCGSCGHLHPATSNRIFDKCDHCYRVFDKEDVELSNLFRLENVSTRRVDRISSDEEERFRL